MASAVPVNHCRLRFCRGGGSAVAHQYSFGAGSHSLKTGPTGQTTNDYWNLLRLYEPKFSPGMALMYSGRLAGLKLADGTVTDVTLEVTNAPGVWGNSTGDPIYDSYVFTPMAAISWSR